MEIETVKGLSLYQPHASLMSLNEKRFETRSWSTHYRGWVAIHATANFPNRYQYLASRAPFRPALQKGGFANVACLPLGCFVAVVELLRVESTNHFDSLTLTNSERAFGDYRADRFVWMCANVIKLPEPIPYLARQRLFDIDDERVLGQLIRATHIKPRNPQAVVQICPGCARPVEVLSADLARFISKYGCEACRDREAEKLGFAAFSGTAARVDTFRS
jgi:activating signal cointegrator 1